MGKRQLMREWPSAGSRPRLVLLGPLFLCIVIALLATGCERHSSQRELRVFAAASLVDVLNETAPEFEHAHPGTHVTVSTAGSQILAAQILEGAECDVFISADAAQLERVASLFAPPTDFASNRIVVVARQRIDVASPTDLARPGLRVVLASEAVPAGRYAREALTKLGITDKVLANVVSDEHDVRGVLTKVAMGEADAGIVYATDAISSGGDLQIVEFPPDAAAQAVYPIAVSKNAADPVLAHEFVSFMHDGKGADAMQRHGFELP